MVILRKVNIPKELLQRLYVEEQLTLNQIADEIGVSRQTIANKLKQYGLTIRNSAYIRSEKQKRKKKCKLVAAKRPYRNKQHFQKVYSELKAIDKVAEYYGINVTTAFDWKKRHGIATIKENNRKASQSRQRMDKPYTNKAWLDKMYSMYSFEDLGKMLNCSPSTIAKWAKKLGIKSRTPEEQWALKSKYGDKCVRKSGFDLLLYEEIYVKSQKTRLPKTIKNFIIDLYGKCESCGYSEVLDLHHIDFNHSNNSPENHAVLCPNCHALIHRRDISFSSLVDEHIVWVSLIK